MLLAPDTIMTRLGNWVRRTYAASVCALLFLASGVVCAQAFESLVMPGKLIEGHAKSEAECKKCHTPFKKAEQSKLCLDCHKAVADDVSAHRGFHGLAPTAQNKECRTCHSDHKGRDAKIAAFDEKAFNHAHSDFQLANAHTLIECKSCHKEGMRYREAPRACAACHRKDDKHKGSLGDKCESCHNDKTWKEARFDHDKTRFSLTGKHTDAKCEACHANAKYKDTPRACLACHKKDDAHKGRYGEKCETCHNADNWKSQFNHAKQTKYPLLGKHATAKCDTCHTKSLFAEKLPTKCVACHGKDDSHKGTLGEKCESCHKETGWTNTNFEHNRDTKFPLFNKHKAAVCGACHKNGLKEKLPLDCFSCHRKDDGHKGQYGKACESCHGDKGWKPSTFNHASATRFVLRDSHASAKCEACHTGTLYVKQGGKALSTDCLSCHRKDDAHKGQLGPQCATCHDERKWAGAKYDHNKSRFKLSGAHARTQCKSCHKSAAFKDAPTICAMCHDGDDVHKRNLGGKCEICHSTRTWKSWDFDHARQTSYPLDGAHLKVNCTSCHRQAPGELGAAMPRPASSCFGCHSGDDIHSGGFGPLCERCHVTRDWRTLKPGIVRGKPAPSPAK